MTLHSHTVHISSFPQANMKLMFHTVEMGCTHYNTSLLLFLTLTSCNFSLWKGVSLLKSVMSWWWVRMNAESCQKSRQKGWKEAKGRRCQSDDRMLHKHMFIAKKNYTGLFLYMWLFLFFCPPFTLTYISTYLSQTIFNLNDEVQYCCLCKGLVKVRKVSVNPLTFEMFRLDF